MLYEDKHFRMSASDVAKILADEALKKFSWRPDGNSGLFFNFTHPQDLIGANADNLTDLKTLIGIYVNPNDKILTTVPHVGIFKDLGYEKVEAFDLSPVQINYFKPACKTYWCDVFNKKMLDTVICCVNPSTVYLSNIPEWSENPKQAGNLAENLTACGKLNKIITSQIFIDDQAIHNSSVFSNTLLGGGWKKNVIDNERSTGPTKMSIFLR